MPFLIHNWAKLDPTRTRQTLTSDLVENESVFNELNSGIFSNDQFIRHIVTVGHGPRQTIFDLSNAFVQLFYILNVFRFINAVERSYASHLLHQIRRQFVALICRCGNLRLKWSRFLYAFNTFYQLLLFVKFGFVARYQFLHLLLHYVFGLLLAQFSFLLDRS